MRLTLWHGHLQSPAAKPRRLRGPTLWRPHKFLLVTTISFHYSVPMPALPYCVYILQSERDGLLYAGFTSDLRQRLTAHFQGQVESTKPRRPLRLIYCEYHRAKSDALRREAYFKSSAGKRAIRLMLREALANPALVQSSGAANSAGDASDADRAAIQASPA